MPSISIVTTVRNGARTIVDCLSAVAAQKGPVEHVVVDGASTDGTVELIRRHAATSTANGHSVRWVSGPDQGIYDGMNRGIAMASGEIVGTLNADDFYPACDILAKVGKLFDDPAVDGCYGDLVFVEDGVRTARDPSPRAAGSFNSPMPVGGGTQTLSDPSVFRVTRYWKAGVCSARRFYWGWMPPHPTFFVRRRLFEKYGSYRLDLGTAADYELMLRFIVRHGITMRYLPEIVIYMRAGGVSTRALRSRWAANRMDRLAWRLNGLRPYPWTTILKPLRKVSQLYRRQVR